MSAPMHAVKKFDRQEQGEATKPDSSPVIRIAIQSQIGTTKIATFETFVDQLTPKSVMDALVDKVMDVSDRQVKKYELVDLKNYLIKEENALRGMQDSLVRHEKLHEPEDVEGRRTPVKLNPKISAERGNMKLGIDEKKKFIQKLRDDIKEREVEFMGSK